MLRRDKIIGDWLSKKSGPREVEIACNQDPVILEIASFWIMYNSKRLY